MLQHAAVSRRACLALAIGCVYRSKGGIALQGAVPKAAETLLAVARGSSGQTHIWLLHALWLLAEAAGLALMPHVKVNWELKHCFPASKSFAAPKPFTAWIFIDRQG